MADIHHMECCGVKELADLSDYPLTDAGARRFLSTIIDEHLTEAPHRHQVYDYPAGEYRYEDVPEKRHAPAFFIFTQAGTATDPNGRTAYGDHFKEWIEAQKLGTVIVTEPNLNENSGNLVKVYVWTVNRDAFLAWKPIKKRKVS
jgi:hypothetical protein